MKSNFKIQLNTIEKWLWYNHNVESLTDEYYQKAKEAAGEYWWSDNDELVMLTVEKNNNYHCEKRKKTWSHRNGAYSKTYYTWTDPTPEEAGILHDKLIAIFEELRIERLKKESDKITGILTEEYRGMVASFRGLRGRMLIDSDWTQLADSPFSDADKTLWRTYRTKLRDMTEDPAWLSNDVFSVDFPVTPTVYLKKDPNREVEYLSVSEHFQNQAALRAKFAAARLYKYLNMPGINMSEEEWENTPYEEIQAKLTKYLKKINTDLEIKIEYTPREPRSQTGRGTQISIDDVNKYSPD
jgi:hypothetical protein